MRANESDFGEYLNQFEKVEAEYDGIEADEDSDGEKAEIEEPYKVQNIRIEQKTITIFQIEHWINAENGKKLNLSPEYQRNLVWDDKRKSALIESLLLRIPIPAFYLDEDRAGNKSVIDGVQRLSTIHSFLNNEFPLKSLQYLSGCEKKYFRDLEPKLRARIEDTGLTVNILDERCPQMVKFDVFRRVNTGGIPLNYQEIRNIMALPKVRKLLKAMTECEEFNRATGNGVKDVRMGAQELCLRYLTILTAYDWKSGEFTQYNGLLKMMDQMVLQLNEASESALDGQFQVFRQVMTDCWEVLGEMSFCKLDHHKINKSLFTGWAVVFANLHSRIEHRKIHVKELRSAYRKCLQENIDFYNAITSSTGTRKNILLSISVIRNLWEEFYDKVN